LRALVDGARRLGRGELDARIDARRRDEFGELARSFNDLGARLEAAARSRRQWIADTSHELRTPLTVMQAQVEAMQDGIRPPDPAGLAGMAAQIGALRRIVDDLDQLARGDDGTLELQLVRLDFWAVAVDAWEGFSDRLRGQGLERRLSPPRGPAIGMGDPNRLGQVLRNLLENSARYTAPGGCVVLSGAIESAHLVLQLDDSAPGVPDAMLGRLGERFFRADASRSREHGGSGLGLALSRQIVEAHGGRLAFDSSPLGGVRARIELPLESK
jgi:two-component system sensor histidine kinase BaeS